MTAEEEYEMRLEQREYDYEYEPEPFDVEEWLGELEWREYEVEAPNPGLKNFWTIVSCKDGDNEIALDKLDCYSEYVVSLYDRLAIIEHENDVPPKCYNSVRQHITDFWRGLVVVQTNSTIGHTYVAKIMDIQDPLHIVIKEITHNGHGLEYVERVTNAHELAHWSPLIIPRPRLEFRGDEAAAIWEAAEADLCHSIASDLPIKNFRLPWVDYYDEQDQVKRRDKWRTLWYHAPENCKR